MIKVQDKPAGLATAPRHTTGSVPVILPRLLPPQRGLTETALSNELGSVLLIVVMPTLFWCAVINGVRSLLGLDTSLAVLGCAAAAIAGFLLIIRASLMIDRSA
jgi:hypothetical protein